MLTKKDSEDRMLTTEEVAKWLGIAPRTVCTWAECSELPAVKIGRQWRFCREDVLRWIEMRTRQRGADTAAEAAVAAKAAYMVQRKTV